MTSPVPAKDHSDTKTDEATTAFHKRRSRRVSFAEITSVHFFDRDEEIETPPDTVPPLFKGHGVIENIDSDVKQCENNGDNDNDNDNDDDDDDENELDGSGLRSPFFRVLGSPSPGGSTVSATSSDGGSPVSATSNDVENFFGPVSSNFIRRRVLDSATSDENHEQTMDSTAFSLQFRSLARSESDGELKTSTRVNLSFGEKTPTPNSSMHLTLVKKPNSQLDASTPRMSTGSPSNDMSLVGNYQNKYNYGILSPAMDPLLAEDLSHMPVLKSPIKDGLQNGNGPDLMDFSSDQDNNMQGIFRYEEHKEVVSDKPNETGFADNGSNFLANQQTVFGVLSNTSDIQSSKSLSPNQFIKDSLTDKTTEPMKDAFGINSSLESLATSQRTPSNFMNMVYQLNESPLVGSVTDRPSHVPLNGVGQFKSPGLVTPSNNPAASVTQRSSVSSIQKSISKLRIFEASPFSAVVTAKLDDVNSRSLAGISKMTPLGNLLEKKVPSTNIDDNKIETPKNLVSKENNIGDEILRESDISIGRMKASLVLNGKTDEQSCHKNLADQFGRSPSNKETYNVVHNENNDSLHAENVSSDISSVERKRKAEHIVTTDKDAKIKKSSNSGLELPSDDGTSSTGPNLEHLSEAHTRISKETQLLLKTVDNMNLHAIDRLIDVLGQLQRAKTYQILSDESRSQDRRVAETKLKLCKLLYEQAKLHLMRVKRERQLKNAHSLASTVQESETLKLKVLQNSLDVQASIHQQSLPKTVKDSQECLEHKDKVTSMVREIEDADMKISDLTKSIHVSCKMKGEPNTADTIAYANTYLTKRAHCQIIRKDMQLWTIDKLTSSNNCHEVVLNYLDLMSQRLTVTTGLAPTLSISITLNHTNINKNFKDLEASTVFGFVFDTGLVQKHATATSLKQETQMTSSIFGNLVDVMEEIQRAKFELKGLVYARFHTSLDERLDLELNFFDTVSRKKATITLNTSCLRRGIYPAEIVTSQIDVSVNGSQNSSSEKLSAEIAAAVQDLGVGFYRIIRFCRCISHLVSQR